MRRGRSDPARRGAGGVLGPGVCIAVATLLAGLAGARPASGQTQASLPAPLDLSLGAMSEAEWQAGLPTEALAQAGSGQIVGKVFKESGSVVPDATVTATNKDTGLVREVMTNQLGEYRLVSLPPGRYGLTVRHEGFKTFEAAEVVVDAGAAITQNATLPTGEVSVAVGAPATSAIPLPMKKNKGGFFDGLKSLIRRIRGRGPS